jgi:hypothetical protein
MTARKTARTAGNAGRRAPKPDDGAPTPSRMQVTFVCPDCGAQTDKPLTPALSSQSFRCIAIACRHVFSPPPDFWDQALTALGLPPQPKRQGSIGLVGRLRQVGDDLTPTAPTRGRHRRLRGWSPPLTRLFTLHFEWPRSEKGELQRSYVLDAVSVFEAKLQAALRYAGASFLTVPPTAYRIVGPSDEVLSRYPEDPQSF